MPPRETVEVSPVPVRATGGGGDQQGFGDKVKAHPIMSGTVLAVAALSIFVIYKKVKGGSTSTSSTAAGTPTPSNSTTSQPYYSGRRHHHFNQGNVTSTNGAGTNVVGSTGNIGSGSSSGTFQPSPNGIWVPPVVGTYTSGAQDTNVAPSGTTTPQPTQGITQSAWTVPTPLEANTVSNPSQNGLQSMTSNGSTTTLPAPQNATSQLPANPGQGEPMIDGSTTPSTPQTRQSQRATILAQRRVS